MQYTALRVFSLSTSVWNTSADISNDPGFFTGSSEIVSRLTDNASPEGLGRPPHVPHPRIATTLDPASPDPIYRALQQPHSPCVSVLNRQLVYFHRYQTFHSQIPLRLSPSCREGRFVEAQGDEVGHPAVWNRPHSSTRAHSRPVPVSLRGRDQEGERRAAGASHMREMLVPEMWKPHVQSVTFFKHARHRTSNPYTQAQHLHQCACQHRRRLVHQRLSAPRRHLHHQVQEIREQVWRKGQFRPISIDIKTQQRFLGIPARLQIAQLQNCVAVAFSSSFEPLPRHPKVGRDPRVH